METYIRLFRCIQPWLNRQYSRMGISEIQASIILALTTEKVCEQHKVAEMICLGKGTVSKVVKQLEADGYIQIERRRKDKRIRVLRPTHKAYYLSQQIQGLHHMMEEILLGDYLAGISEHLEHYLREMMKNVPFLIEREYLPESPYSIDDIPDDPRKITPEQWEAMKAVDIRTVDKSQLVDLNTVQIDESLPVQERVLSYLKQVKNPYCVRVGNVAAKVTYKEDGPSFEEVFKHLLRQQSMM